MKEDIVFLNHILECINDIEDYSKGISLSKFVMDKKTHDAVIRKLEIIGEATKNLSEKFRIKHKSVDWRVIAGFRDKLIHKYFGINLELVWEVIKRDLPLLKDQIEFIIKGKK